MKKIWFLESMNVKKIWFFIAMLVSGIANAQVYTEIHPPGWMMSTPANPCQQMAIDKAAAQTQLIGYQMAKATAQANYDAAIANAIAAYNAAYNNPMWAGYYATQNTYWATLAVWWASKVGDYDYLINQVNAEIATLNAAYTAAGC